MYSRVQIYRWLQNLLLRHITKHLFHFFRRFVRVCLQSLQKILKWPRKMCFQKCNMGIKNAKINADFESVGKVAKRLMRKKLSAKKWTKNRTFDFYYCGKKFSAYNFFWVSFSAYFEDSKSASNFAFMIPVSNFCEIFVVAYISSFC